VPQPLLFSNDVSEILARLERHQIKTMGRAATSLLWPVNRQQAKELLDYFCRYCLPRFGQFQDAMTCQLNQLEGDKQWSLYHSRLSFALNSKIISPKLVVERVLAHYRAQPEQLLSAEPQINLAQVEGFIRQILGWREFVRGIYWANMPEYAILNALSAKRALPAWFWSGKTKMSCLKHAIEQSLDYAYAHHIQRLMITGNFCLLAGIDPDEVDAWYLGVYIDALEWVEMPNTRGMSQFADGGIVGSKAYAASGNYVKKMSDYCGYCHYKVAKTTEADACPLNSLYWRFIHQQQQLLGNNPRNAMVYANWQKKTAEQQQAILTQAELYLNAIEQL
jgi:deoxyribodipyrimidine photolyase-related protein